MKKLSWLLIVILMTGIMAFGAESFNKRSPIAKTTALNDIWMNCNRMNGIMRNNGTWFYDNIIGDWGLEWPQVSGISPIYAAGQWIGTTINGAPRIAGVIHGSTDYQPGM
ncbi:MAG: hypothetical protein PHW79_03080, partial [Candidatus Marinimicrobia bacterium]|nr:hypothetical protein [Candidatus Neomarinimicrobiota bacterium]